MDVDIDINTSKRSARSTNRNPQPATSLTLTHATIVPVALHSFAFLLVIGDSGVLVLKLGRMKLQLGKILTEKIIGSNKKKICQQTEI